MTTKPLESWEGARVLVTGASSGIGAALARELAGAGAVVGMCARRTAMLEETLADCRRSVPGCRAWTVDLSDLDGLEAFAARVRDELGGIDVLVNNAALGVHGDALGTPWDAIEEVVRLDYLSPVRLTRAVLPDMLERGSGHVVVVSSMAARMSTPGESAYAAAKAALAAWFESLAGELWETPVGVHLVYPAIIDLTPGVDGDDALVDAADGARPVPAPVCAREILRLVERGDLDLYVPHVMRDIVAERARDLPSSVDFMSDWYRAGSPQ